MFDLIITGSTDESPKTDIFGDLTSGSPHRCFLKVYLCFRAGLAPGSAFADGSFSDGMSDLGGFFAADTRILPMPEILECLIPSELEIDTSAEKDAFIPKKHSKPKKVDKTAQRPKPKQVDEATQRPQRPKPKQVDEAAQRPKPKQVDKTAQRPVEKKPSSSSSQLARELESHSNWVLCDEFDKWRRVAQTPTTKTWCCSENADPKFNTKNKYITGREGKT